VKIIDRRYSRDDSTPMADGSAASEAEHPDAGSFDEPARDDGGFADRLAAAQRQQQQLREARRAGAPRPEVIPVNTDWLGQRRNDRPVKR
jgi:hypothetical protein